jgi:thiol-disulfide isomerase/thioredoxin
VLVGVLIMDKLIYLMLCLTAFGCHPRKNTDPILGADSSSYKGSIVSGIDSVTINKLNTDSIEIVATMFLYKDVEKGLEYYLEEPDIDKVFNQNKYWVKTYFPIILEKYNLKYYQKLNIAYYLYKVGSPKYFQELAKDSNLSKEDKRVLNWYINNYIIDLN